MKFTITYFDEAEGVKSIERNFIDGEGLTADDHAVNYAQDTYGLRHIQTIATPTNDTVSPWVPMTDPLSLKHIGKLGEESGELNAAVSRCIIQGIDETEPTSGKVNRQWLTEEIADVKANIILVTEHFNLDTNFINERSSRKIKNLRKWHAIGPNGEINHSRTDKFFDDSEQRRYRVYANPDSIKNPITKGEFASMIDKVAPVKNFQFIGSECSITLNATELLELCKLFHNTVISRSENEA